MRRIVGSLLLVVVLTLGASATAHATRLQGGSITWERDATSPDPKDGRFKIHVEAVLRWNFPWAQVGPNPAVGASIGEFSFTYGPFPQTIAPPLVVQSINIAENWMVAAGDFLITVPINSFPTTLQFQACCRPPDLLGGNASVDMRLQTTLVGSATRSPRPSVAPRIYLEANQLVDFLLPALGADSLTNQFRLATAAESRLVTPPAGLTISATGRVNWTPPAAGKYAAQFIVSNASNASVPIDVIFDVRPPATTQPKVSFAAGLCGSTVETRVGVESIVHVSASSTLANDPVTITSTPLPAGALLAGSGSNLDLRWTPGLGQLDQVVCFNATTASGATSIGNCCVTMAVVTPVIRSCLMDGVSVLPADYVSTSALNGTASIGAGDTLVPIDFKTGAATGDRSGAIWLGGAPQKLGSGFALEFTFSLKKKAPATTEGFALVLQSSGPTALGAGGSGLGYAGIPGGLAIEFDPRQNTNLFDPAYSHVSFHPGFLGPLSASESPPAITSVYDGALPLSYDNGTVQTVRIEYRPAETREAPGGGPALGSLKAYFNKNWGPQFEAQVDDQAIAAVLGPEAYVGFTASNSATLTPIPGLPGQFNETLVTDQQLQISNVKLTASFGTDGRVFAPPAPVAPGATGQLVVEAVNQCGAPMKVGGEAAKWAVTLMDGGAIVPTTIVDLGDGRYAITFVAPPTERVLQANVAFNGLPIPGSPIAITVVDAPPVFSGVPANLLVEATGPLTAVAWSAPTALDAIQGPVPVTCSADPGSTFPLGTTTVTCLASDSAGHSASATFDVTVTDTTPPAFAAVSDVVAEATGPNGAAVTLSPLATDLVDGPVTVICEPTSGSDFALGTTAVLCKASDAHGNASSTQLTVTVRDTTPPALTVSPDLTVEPTGPAGATVSFAAPTAQDLVDGNVSGAVHCAPASGSTFAPGTTTVSCSVADAAGNTASKSFAVKVFDSTGPTFTAPSDITVEADSASGAFVTYALPTATDTVDGQVPVTCVPSPGNLFPIGETLVSCVASDEPGNVTTKTFKVTVTDVSPPQLSGVPAGGLVEATGLGGAIAVYATPTATDTVDGPLPVSCLPASGSLFPLGVNVVVCQATDSSGHVASAAFPVTVVDTTPPLLTLPGTLAVEATGATGAAVTFAATAADLVAGATPVLCSASSGDVFPLGSTVVQCSTSDLLGNVATGAFTVVVKDTTAPTLTGVPAALTVSATSASGAVVTYQKPTATDLAGGAIPVSCVPAAGSTFPVGTTTVTCTASDAAGNTATAKFTVTVRDSSGPVFGALPSPTAYATSTSGATVSYALPKAIDALDGQRPVTCTPASGSRFAPGATTVTCKASDKNGNTTTATFTVKVTYEAPTDGKFFLQPINPDGSSIFKLGSTVPVKFELTGASDCIRNLVAKLTLTKVGDGVGGTVVEAASTSAADSGNTFRYSGGQYIFNLSTKSLTKGTWLLKADLGDGVEHTIRISLK